MTRKYKKLEAEQVAQWYFNAATTLKKVSDEKHQADAPAANNPQVIRVEAPRRIDVGKFDGDFAAWPAFRDLFEAEVLNNGSLQDVEKLIYLQKACVGMAKLAVGGWQPLAQNFAQAYTDLKGKFEDPYRLQQALISKMMTLPVMQEETYNNLRKIMDTCTNSLRQLETMGVPVAHWDAIVINIIMSKLPVSTIDVWEQKRISIPKVGLKELITFLEGKARGRVHLDLRLGPGPQNGNQKRGERTDTNSNNKAQGPQRSEARNLPESAPSEKDTAAYGPMKCRYWGGPHPVFLCKDDLLKNPKEKIPNLLASKGICSNCLRMHPIDKCSGMPCPRCPNVKHNSIICPKYVPRQMPAVNAVHRIKGNDNRRHPYNP